MKLREATLEEYVEKLHSRKPFTLSRFGDGEWYALLGDRGTNCDHVKYTKELEKSLLRTVLHPKEYDYGMLQIAIQEAGRRIEEFIDRYQVSVNWIDATFVTAANRFGRLYPLVRELREHDILYVGPAHLRQLGDKVFDYKYFVEVPKHKAFEDRVEIRRKILKHADRVDLVGVSMGPGAKVLIHTLFTDIGKDCTVFDFGSLWDGYFGVFSRKYMQKDDWELIMRANLGIV